MSEPDHFHNFANPKNPTIILALQLEVRQSLKCLSLTFYDISHRPCSTSVFPPDPGLENLFVQEVQNACDTNTNTPMDVCSANKLSEGVEWE